MPVMYLISFTFAAIFGQRLEETMRYEYQNSRRKIPQIVEMCVEFLNKHGIEMEGIFR